MRNGCLPTAATLGPVNDLKVSLATYWPLNGNAGLRADGSGTFRAWARVGAIRSMSITPRSLPGAMQPKSMTVPAQSKMTAEMGAASAGDANRARNLEHACPPPTLQALRGLGEPA